MKESVKTLRLETEIKEKKRVMNVLYERNISLTKKWIHSQKEDQEFDDNTKRINLLLEKISSLSNELTKERKKQIEKQLQTSLV